MSAVSVSSDMDQFLALVSENWETYSHSGLSYHAVREGECLTILHARLFLDPRPANLSSKKVPFLSQEIGYIPLRELTPNGPEIIRCLVNGEHFETPNGKICFPLDKDNSPSMIFRPIHELGLPAQRLAVLTITGARLKCSRFSMDLDWNLKANNPPYDSLVELLAEFRLGGYVGDFSCIEIPAYNLAEIDLNSKISGSNAEPGVILPEHADRKMFQLGMIVYDKGIGVNRLMLQENQLTWTTKEISPSQFIQYGSTKFKVPLGVTIKCFAIYRGLVQHMGWIADPQLFPNWRRVVYECVDPKFEILLDSLFEGKKERKVNQDFEEGIATILWILGFAPLQLIHPRLKNNPDILVSTPAGKMILAECTTGLIDKEDKLGKLHSRSISIKGQLEKSGVRFLELLPILITALPANEIMDIDKASKLGILVLTQEDLRAALDRSYLYQDPEAVFKEQLQVLEARQEAVGNSITVAERQKPS